MSIFRIYVDGQLFYHPQLSQLAITEAKMTEDAENIDSLTLSAPFNHPYLDSIHPMASTIVCKKGDNTVFEGRALNDGSDFYNTHTWTCESALAYLKDSQQPPFSYKGTLKGLLEYFLSVHNKAVEEKKRFKLGNITVTDNNDYISYSNSEYSCTLDAIKSKLINTHGGYLMVRYTDSGKVLDYLAEFNVHSIQTVEYGKNLMDVKITRDHTERIAALIPLGAKKKTTDEEGNEVESDERIDITSVNGGQNYIYDDAAVKEIGWIWTTEVWENVTLPGNLLRKANARLAELIAGITSMELSIVDESDTGADIGSIHARQFVDCLSPPHGIDGRYACMSKTVDYLNPSGNTITIGASGIKLTTISAKQNENLTAIEDELLGQTATIEGISGKVDGIAASKMYRTELIVDGIVWRCISRLESTGLECHARTINELFLQDAVVKAINQMLGDKSSYQAQLQLNIASVIRASQATSVENIDEKLMALQQELIQKAQSKEVYDEIADEIFRLRELRQQTTVDTAARDEQIKRINDLQDYISQQSTHLTEFDESLVRRWVKQITIWDDRITVELKSGVSIDVDA